MGFTTDNKAYSQNNETQTHYKFKDNLAYEREKIERRIAEELEEKKRNAKFPLPTFEQLSREKERLKRDHTYSTLKSCLTIFFLILIITFTTLGTYKK